MSQSYHYIATSSSTSSTLRNQEDWMYTWDLLHTATDSIDTSGGPSGTPHVCHLPTATGYPTAVTQCTNVRPLAMALPVLQQQAQVAGPHCYGSQDVDPRAFTAWGRQQYGLVDGPTLSESINPNQLSHGASSARQDNADGRPMSLHGEGLMETTESPHPTSAYEAPSGHFPHHGTAPACPLSPSHTLSPGGPSTTPTFPPSYQEASGSATQASSVSSPRQSPPPIPAPTRPRKKRTSSKKKCKATTGVASRGRSQGAQSPVGLPLKEWRNKANRLKAPPEQKRGQREDGGRLVLYEYEAIADELKEKDRSEVSLDGNFYITTWKMFKDIPYNFLRCEEKGCRYNLKRFYYRCFGFRQHLRTHAKAKVVREAGETEKSYQERQNAAGEAKIHEEKYIQMIENFKSLDLLVKSAAALRLGNITM